MEIVSGEGTELITDIILSHGDLDVARFREEYEHPFLVVETGDFRLSTGEFRTILADSGELPKASGRAKELRYYRVHKSKRNEFSDMITVGRTLNNDVVVDIASVSKFHAYFRNEGDGVYSLTDAGSMNGTFIEGRRLEPHEKVVLEDSTIIHVSPDARLRFLYSEGFHSYIQVVKKIIDRS